MDVKDGFEDILGKKNTGSRDPMDPPPPPQAACVADDPEACKRDHWGVPSFSDFWCEQEPAAHTCMRALQQCFSAGRGNQLAAHVLTYSVLDPLSPRYRNQQRV